MINKFRQLNEFDKNNIIKFVKNIKLSENFDGENESDKITILKFLDGLAVDGVEYLCEQLGLEANIYRNSIEALKN